MAEGAEISSGGVLVSVREQTVEFYGDVLSAAQSESGEVYVPLRPICEYLGLSWPGQRERTNRDPVLAEALRFVRVTHTNSAGGAPDVLALPLDMLPGWLFGISESRVKPELRERIQRYRRECFKVLWNAFKGDVLPTPPATSDLSSAELAVENARALLHLAEQQLEFERRLSTMADYMRPFVKGYAPAADQLRSATDQPGTSAIGGRDDQRGAGRRGATRGQGAGRAVTGAW